MTPLIYVGLDRPADAAHLDRVMLSYNSLERRQSCFEVGRWILDSGAFTRVVSGKGHVAVKQYAAAVRRWRGCGQLEAAVPQDYMCEPIALRATGKTVNEHQLLTTARWLALRDAVPEQYVLPVLQGWTPQDYQRHVDQIDAELPKGAWVGVGSVCKRQGAPTAISAVLTAILEVRPDLLLHGFGVKATALALTDIRARFHSIDSMAWSYAARRQGRNQHDWREAYRMARATAPYVAALQHREYGGLLEHPCDSGVCIT